MSLAGKEIRMRRIFKDDGRTFVITMDHGASLGPLKGIENIKATIKKVLAGDYKPDAILLTPSMIRYCSREIAGKLGIIARIDGAATTLGPDITNFQLFSSVEEALKVGADAVATMAFIGVEAEFQNLKKVGEISQECEKWGMLQVVEALPPEIIQHHFKRKAKWKWPDPEHVKFVARIASEMGADIVKSYYTGDPKTFREVVESCPVPIIVLSGPGASDQEGLLRIIRDAIDSGAKGVIMGRNIWGQKDPSLMIKVISKMIHEDETVENAFKMLKSAHAL